MSELQQVGVIGAGSFGTSVANLLAENRHVHLYSRRSEQVEEMNKTRLNAGQELHENITATSDLAAMVRSCYLLFPVVPSQNFKGLIREMAPHLKPDHILIHGTKGLAVRKKGWKHLKNHQVLLPEHVLTMSELIQKESVVVRVGCLAGPNLSKEIARGLPAAAVLASRFDEVIQEGQDALKSNRFHVYGGHDIFGIELAGVLKNILAIGSGVVSGLEFGENARAMLITKGLSEIIHLAKAMGADVRSFLGLAGIGDIIATCSSPSSRNYTVGYRLAKGETIQEILASMDEVAEGVNTTRIASGLVRNFELSSPIISTLYKGLYEGLSLPVALEYLLNYRFSMDVDFL
jgi:glycerol-3-phosphate dehydrogenase (NAD(P)+)